MEQKLSHRPLSARIFFIAGLTGVLSMAAFVFFQPNFFQIAFASNPPDLSITATPSSGFSNAFYIGQTYTLMLTGAPANATFTICAIFPAGTRSCTPNWGMTDQNGNWATSTQWTAATTPTGDWDEIIEFPAQNINSNGINFTMAASGPGTATQPPTNPPVLPPPTLPTPVLPPQAPMSATTPQTNLNTSPINNDLNGALNSYTQILQNILGQVSNLPSSPSTQQSTLSVSPRDTGGSSCQSVTAGTSCVYGHCQPGTNSLPTANIYTSADNTTLGIHDNYSVTMQCQTDSAFCASVANALQSTSIGEINSVPGAAQGTFAASAGDIPAGSPQMIVIPIPGQLVTNSDGVDTYVPSSQGAMSTSGSTGAEAFVSGSIPVNGLPVQTVGPNTCYIFFYEAADGGAGNTDYLTNTGTHEMLHCLGADHTNSVPNIMNGGPGGSLSPGYNNTILPIPPSIQQTLAQLHAGAPINLANYCTEATVSCTCGVGGAVCQPIAGSSNPGLYDSTNNLSITAPTFWTNQDLANNQVSLSCPNAPHGSDGAVLGFGDISCSCNDANGAALVDPVCVNLVTKQSVALLPGIANACEYANTSAGQSGANNCVNSSGQLIEPPPVGCNPTTATDISYVTCTCPNGSPSCVDSLTGVPTSTPSTFACSYNSVCPVGYVPAEGNTGGCVAAPAAATCTPDSQQDCASAANSCGMTNTGQQFCNSDGSWGACDATAPPDTSCDASNIAIDCSTGSPVCTDSLTGDPTTCPASASCPQSNGICLSDPTSFACAEFCSDNPDDPSCIGSSNGSGSIGGGVGGGGVGGGGSGSVGGASPCSLLQELMGTAPDKCSQ